MTLPEIITLIKDILLGLAAITTASVAVYGVRNWSRELMGKAEFETARNLMRATYRLRDELAACRSPFVRGHEYPYGYLTKMGEPTPEEHERAWTQVLHKRWEPVLCAIPDFDTFTLEAEALWGGEFRIKTDKLRECMAELHSSMETLIVDYRSGGEVFKTDVEMGIRTRATVFSTGPGENELSNKIADSIAGIEAEVLPHLKRN